VVTITVLRDTNTAASADPFILCSVLLSQYPLSPSSLYNYLDIIPSRIVIIFDLADIRTKVISHAFILGIYTGVLIFYLSAANRICNHTVIFPLAAM
jgi:hypothetical protein